VTGPLRIRREVPGELIRQIFEKSITYVIPATLPPDGSEHFTHHVRHLG